MEEIIKTIKLSKIYHHLTSYQKIAVDCVSLSICKGDFISIMGKSGSGKTTLLNVLATIDDLTKGQLYIYGKNIFAMSDKQKAIFRKENIGIIFQNYNLLDTLTVQENILLPMKLSKKRLLQSDFDQIIKELEIDDILDHYPFECSGGQLQRAAVARTLLAKPKIIFADEPTGNLDGVRSRQFMQYLLKINEHYHITIVIVTHDPLVASYSSIMYYLEDGTIKTQIKKEDYQDRYLSQIIALTTGKA